MISAEHQKPFDLLYQALIQNRLSHAYLLSGTAGIGKTDFARAFAALLLCEKKAVTQPCGKCRGCVLMQAGNHPDFLLVMPEEKAHSIKIDQIRHMTQQLSHTAHATGYRVVIISPANAMPVQAANALLKTLEEPVGKTVIFLIDDQKNALPATISSRCQKIFFSDSQIDLRLHDNTTQLRDQILQQLEQIQQHRMNPIASAAGLLKSNLEAVLRIFLLLCVDISRLQLGASKKHVVNADVYEKLLTLSQKISPITLQHFIEKLVEKNGMILRGVNLNQQLCLENLLIEWEK